jgi:hypothetical protein
MRSWFMALALTATFAGTALAGGMHAKVEGPGPDGVTYTARMYACDPDTKFDPWAHAEGMVDGKRQSVLLRVKPTGEHGVYTFQRAWPEEGKWMVRFVLGHPPAPATVVTLGAGGAVERNQLFHKTDGAKECHRLLGGKTRMGKHSKGDDDGC